MGNQSLTELERLLHDGDAVSQPHYHSLRDVQRIERVQLAFWLMLVVHTPSVVAGALLTLRHDGSHVAAGAVAEHDVSAEHQLPILAAAAALLFLADGIEVSQW